MDMETFYRRKHERLFMTLLITQQKTKIFAYCFLSVKCPTMFYHCFLQNKKYDADIKRTKI